MRHKTPTKSTETRDWRNCKRSERVTGCHLLITWCIIGTLSFRVTLILKGDTLESLCRVALNTPHNGTPLWERPGTDADTGDKESRKMFLNKVADLSSAVFGEICLAQSGDLQAILQMHPSKIQLSELTTAVVYELEERQAPQDRSSYADLPIGLGLEITYSSSRRKL